MENYSHYYKFEHGSYYFYSNEQMTFMTDEISICYDAESMTLHKHGNPKSVLNWFNKSKQKLEVAGFHDIANNLCIISGYFPVEELNILVNNSTYLEHFIKKINNLEILPLKKSNLEL